MVLVGDSKQLPPFSRQKGENAAVSLLERVDHTAGSAMLTTQYRMPETINRIVSNLYYDGKLLTSPSVWPSGKVEIHTVKGDAEKEDNGHSLFNQLEADKCIDIAASYAQKNEHGSVAILAFYKAQVRLIKSIWDTDVMVPKGVEIMSVDSAQGQEFDHVVLSCVVNGHQRSFLEDRRRMNVALSRAKKTLDVVCHTETPLNLGAIRAVQTAASGGHVAIGHPPEQARGGKGGKGGGKGGGGRGRARGRGR
jgi:superfamily I DNA and/or RNA helicase